ncbi:HepT-like ribonuclease domain-containing protein [Sulfurimonas sp.]|uniref:HepT-like ribonuclease domain-containing protein n=1 Tax=Sulfurimonas sp. TaxID=2022749 RepID=UPI003D0B7E82
MSKTRDTKLYIADILDASSAIESFIDSMNFEEFINDRKTYSATLREYTVLGEAIGKILDILEAKHPDYPWKMVKDFRNFIVHEYFGVDPQIVWDLTKLELPQLSEKVRQLK